MRINESLAAYTVKKRVGGKSDGSLSLQTLRD